MTGMGKSRPMTPVEQTSICSGRQPIASAATAVMRQASSSPCWPVQALALPEQMTTPRMSSAGRRSWQTRTGAARTRFCVKTPAAAAGAIAHHQGQVETLGIGANAAMDASETIAVSQMPVVHELSVMSNTRSSKCLDATHGKPDEPRLRFVLRRQHIASFMDGARLVQQNPEEHPNRSGRPSRLRL